jgi:hypothetical protein
MELTLNLGWALLAAWMMCAWLRATPRAARDRRAQFVALAVAILILLPTISMTDDLIAAQNPAEPDCCMRRDHSDCPHHPITPATAAIPLPGFSGLSFGFVQFGASSRQPEPHPEIPALTSIQNRPPPTA